MGDAGDPFLRNQSAGNVQARTKAQNRATVLQLKLIGQSHPTGLTPNLLKLFEPRAPLEFKPPPERRKCPPLSGMAQFVSRFAEPDDPEYAPPKPTCETPAQKRERIHKLRLENGAQKAAEELEKYDPSKDPNTTGDPYKTLFVARLNYETSENRLKREFETYGPIKKVRIIYDKDARKPRGYAFIEYLHTRDMKNAYKQADGRKIDGRRVLVDVERGRTVANWRPRRLGGGLGSTRVGGEEVNQKYSGREGGHQASGHAPRSEEPRNVERDREKSRDRGRDRERDRERSHERPHDRGRDRDPREDRHHHRDRDRDRDRERERERDRGRDRDRDRDRGRDTRDGGRERDRDRDRDRGRELRDYDRDRPRDRDREKHRERERDYNRGGHDEDRNRGRDRARDYDYEPNHGQGYPIDDEHEHGQIIEGYDYPPFGNPQSTGDHVPERDARPRDDGYYKHAPYDKMESEGPNGQHNLAAPASYGREWGPDEEFNYHHVEKPPPEGYGQ